MNLLALNDRNSTKECDPPEMAPPTQAATRHPSKKSAFYSGHSFCRACFLSRRVNRLPTTGLRASAGANSNDPQQDQANLNGEGQHSIVGYKFGYRHQFGSITDNYAKLLIGSHLTIYPTLRSISLIYHRLTVFLRDSKSADRKVVGVRPPLPAP